jgi:ABC-type sugar transport system substrate-binding protein
MKILATLALCGLLSAAALAPANAAEAPAVAMGFGGSTIALWNDELALMRPVIEAAGYRLLTDDPQFHVEKQVQDWEAWIAQGDVKAIMGWPINAPSMVPVTRKADQAGIKVIGYAVAWKGVAASLLTDPEKDGKNMASYAVAWVKKTYGDKPVSIAVLSDQQNDLTRLRVQGLYEEVKQGLPNAQIYHVPALTREDGYTAAKQHLTAHPDTTVWLSYSNDNLKGVYKALLDTHVAKDDPKYFLAGMDVTNEDLNLIRVPNSIYRMAFAFQSRVLAKVNCDMLLAAARGEAVKDVFVTPDVVTPENAQNFYVGNVNH